MPRPLNRAFAHWTDLLLGGENSAIAWTTHLQSRALGFCILTIVCGVGSYGFSMGLWNGPRMAVYLAIKLPLIIVITLSVNALINGVLAQLLGSRLSFPQTWFAILSSFTIFALVVGALSPITTGMALEIPASDSAQAGETHRRLLVFHTLIIGLGGFAATCRLLRLFEHFCPNRKSAIRCVVGLLAGNLFVGAQISFLMRPILCQPGLPVEFLRPDMFTGNFYESVIWALKHSF